VPTRRATTEHAHILSFARVLIATADDGVANFLDEHLREWGFAGHRVRDGHEALALLTEGDAPRIVLLDATLPQSSGMEVAAQIRRREGRRLVWTVLLEDEVDAGKIAQARDAGIDDILLKPVDALELRVRVSVADRVQALMNQLHAQTAAAYFHEQHDKLTGLWNRDTVLRLLFTETDRSQRLKSPLALVVIDLDYFGKINNDYGHDAGDKILKELTKRLRRFLRSYDLIGRLGEDEFLVALPGCTSQEALSLARRVKRSVLSRPFTVGRELLTVTASVGIAHSDGRSPLVVLKEAEQALASAKRAGRNCEREYAPEQTRETPKAEMWVMPSVSTR
jgi:diguanylate cyclase (GGDEF)-like protein